MDTILRVEQGITLKTWLEGKNVDGGIQSDIRGLVTTLHSIRHGAASD
jgi:hypothetical protein